MTLTFQQVGILRLILELATNKEIAKKLGMSTRGVTYQVCEIYKKHNVHSRLDLVKLYGEFEVTVTWRPNSYEKIVALSAYSIVRGSNPDRPLSAGDFRDRSREPTRVSTANRPPARVYSQSGVRNGHGGSA